MVLLFIDPEPALHSRQYFRLLIGRPVVRPRRCIQHIYRTPFDLVLSRQLEVECVDQLIHEQMVALALAVILGDAGGAVALRFPAPPRDLLFQLRFFFLLFMRRQSGAIDGDQLRIRRSIDHQNLIGLARSWFARAVESPRAVCLSIRIIWKRIPVGVIDNHRTLNDLASGGLDTEPHTCPQQQEDGRSHYRLRKKDMQARRQKPALGQVPDLPRGLSMLDPYRTTIANAVHTP